MAQGRAAVVGKPSEIGAHVGQVAGCITDDGAAGRTRAKGDVAQALRCGVYIIRTVNQHNPVQSCDFIHPTGVMVSAI